MGRSDKVESDVWPDAPAVAQGNRSSSIGLAKNYNQAGMIQGAEAEQRSDPICDED